MKSALFIVFIFFLLPQTFAHNFYFAYAEVEYNELNQRLELSLSGTAHDFEAALLKEYGYSCKWGKVNLTTKDTNLIENYINKHLRFSYDCKNETSTSFENCSTTFHLEGIQFNKDGSFMCFLSAPIQSNLMQNLSAQFDFLMETYSEQQNKLTFIYRDKSQTLVFIKPQSQAIKSEE